eukprot:scaffold27781_cov146-Isochrysis_galbana.AAC.1
MRSLSLVTRAWRPTLATHRERARLQHPSGNRLFEKGSAQGTGEEATTVGKAHSENVAAPQGATSHVHTPIKSVYL